MMALRYALTGVLACLACAAAGAAPPLTEQVAAAARAQLDQQMAAGNLAEPEFDLDVVTARAAPACAAPVVIEALDTRQPARMRFVARCPDGRGWRHDFVVHARISALVAVAAAPVVPGRALEEADVTLARRDVTGVPDPVASVGDALGQTSRRSLRAGDVLRAGQLAAPIVVRRGDPVTMQARHDGIEVSMAGEALDAGARGTVVRVKNSASGQVVRMRVLGAGSVQPIDLPLGE